MSSTARPFSTCGSSPAHQLPSSAARTKAIRAAGIQRRNQRGLSSKLVAPLNILVTGACGVTPRAIARSLRASSPFADARLVGADRGGNWYGFYEGPYERGYRDSEPSDPGYPEL